MPCPRCSGLMIVEPGEHVGDYEGRCLLCGHRVYPQLADPIDNTLRRWDSVLCHVCDKKAVRGREKCIACAAKDRGRSHSQMIKDGIKAKREQEALTA